MKSKTKSLKLAIIGLGYVGLPLALEFAKKRPTIGFDLNKNRSFSLGYDAMLLSFAIKNKIHGEIRGLNGIYFLDEDDLFARSYIN